MNCQFHTETTFKYCVMILCPAVYYILRELYSYGRDVLKNYKNSITFTERVLRTHQIPTSNTINNYL